jgi:hypothetical protein
MVVALPSSFWVALELVNYDSRRSGPSEGMPNKKDAVHHTARRMLVRSVDETE